MGSRLDGTYCHPEHGETPPYPNRDDYCDCMSYYVKCNECKIIYYEMPEKCQKEILKELNLDEISIRKYEDYRYEDIKYLLAKEKLNG